jgi:hypothetical protein
LVKKTTAINTWQTCKCGTLTELLLHNLKINNRTEYCAEKYDTNYSEAKEWR